uniref:Uncharacterized protein n=1 Tax=Lepeophtheirus salmonis TaxID=72036 RepID=A0A0K2U350_LEPSM
MDLFLLSVSFFVDFVEDDFIFLLFAFLPDTPPKIDIRTPRQTIPTIGKVP